MPEIPPCLSPLTSRPSGGSLAAEGRVEGQAALAAIPFGADRTGSDRSGRGVAVFLLSGAVLGLLARRRARA